MSIPVIHVVDDEEAVRIAMARLLRVEGYEVRTHASAGAFLLTPPRTPGCIVLDLRMPGPSGLDLQEALGRYPVTLPIVFVTGRGDVASSVRAMKAGAVDFLIKPVDPPVLLKAVETALLRDRAARAQQQDFSVAKTRYRRLTLRERSVLERVVAGKLNKEIAGELGITERTVKMHRAQVMAKMEAGSLVQLVRTADLLARAGVVALQATPGH